MLTSISRDGSTSECIWTQSQELPPYMWINLCWSVSTTGWTTNCVWMLGICQELVTQRKVAGSTSSQLGWAVKEKLVFFEIGVESAHNPWPGGVDNITNNIPSALMHKFEQMRVDNIVFYCRTPGRHGLSPHFPDCAQLSVPWWFVIADDASYS
jgi:hypothetical protein